MTLEVLTSELLSPLGHGFFTRRGGASSGVFGGLNCGFGSSDQREAVSINRSRAAGALGLGPEALATVHQVHSAAVVVLDAAPAEPRPPADAMVTRTPGLALCVLTADCLPILLADPEAGVIGAVHAGWRGALAGVIGATVEAMAGQGAEPRRIRAAIGPAISQRAYEVGPELLDAFLDANPGHGRFFLPGEGDRLLFDLPCFGLAALRAAGVGEAEWLRHCTYSDAGRFFSFRRATHLREADYGRLLSAIRL